MRYRAMLILAIAGMFTVATTAVSQANWYQKSEGSDQSSSEYMSPSGESNAQSAEPGTYEYEQQMETGNLPGLGTSPGGEEQFSPGSEDLQVIEQGGATFRVGIDGE